MKMQDIVESAVHALLMVAHLAGGGGGSGTMICKRLCGFTKCLARAGYFYFTGQFLSIIAVVFSADT